ncbi:type III-B CRISPR module-associated Cmr3 family protein [Aliarcobacter butzleri]
MRLKPLKPFFFGKEKVFANTNYVSSEYFPQQTQILGSIRAYLLESNGLLKIHKNGKFCSKEIKEEALQLVGSANSENFDTLYENDLGIINFISPMFINKILDNQQLSSIFAIPDEIIEFEEKKEEKTLKILKKVNPKKLDGIISNNNAVILENYNSKIGFKKAFGDKLFWENYINNEEINNLIEPEDIFISSKQVGITLKGLTKIVEEEKFYTKESYLLKDKFEFAILIDIKNELKLKDGIITIGGESSTFSLKIEDLPNYFEEHPIIKIFKEYKEDKKGKKIVLLSDSILENSIQKNSFYQIISNKVPFRMMTSNTNKIEPSFQKTQTKLLVGKGSIYYFDDATSLPKAKGAYSKMGFNQYLTLE